MAAEEQGGNVAAAPETARAGSFRRTDKAGVKSAKPAGRGWVKAAVHHVLHDREPVIGVDITPGHIRLCEMQQHDTHWELKALAAATVEVDKTIHDIRQHEAIYAEKLRALYAASGIRTKYAAVALPVGSSIVRTISAPHMSDEDIQKAISMGTFWQTLVQLSVKLKDYSIYYEVLGRDAQAGTMDILFVASRNSDIALYTGILKQAGLQPMVADVHCFALQNAFRLNREVIDDGAPTVLLKFGADENYILLEDRGKPYQYEIYIADNEREAIEAQLANPEFIQRFATQVKQMLAKHGAKHAGFGQVKRIRVVSLLPALQPFVDAVDAALPDYEVRLWDAFHHVQVPESLAATVAAEGNPAAWAMPMGLAVRSLTIVDWFHHADHTDHVNLLPQTEEFIKAQRVGLFSRLGLSAYTVVAVAACLVMTLLLLGQVRDINAELRQLQQIEQEHAQKTSVVTGLRARAGKLRVLQRVRDGLSANQEVLLESYGAAAAKIPDGVWLSKMQFSPPATVEMTGRALDDAGILEFIHGLDQSGQFSQVVLKTMQAEKDDSTAATVKMFTLHATVGTLQAMEDEKAKAAEAAAAAAAAAAAKPVEVKR